MNDIGSAFRAVMRQVPFPVAVVTTSRARQRRGVTIGSFTSVSMEPPLVSFNVMHASRMYPMITMADRYAVHVLAAEQVAVSDLFAEPGRLGEDQFAKIPHTIDHEGVPLIDGTVAILHCAAHAAYEAGDHVLLVGRVLRTTDGPGTVPLVYYARKYWCLGKQVAP